MAGVRAMAASMMMLRIFAFLLLTTSVALMVTNKFNDSAGDKRTFKDIIAYSGEIVSGACWRLQSADWPKGLLQLPFAIYYTSTEQRMIHNDYLAEFDFYGDKIISYTRVSFELKRFVDDFFDFLGVLMQLGEDDKSDAGRFLVWGSVATGLPAGVLLLMAVLSALSFINRSLPR